MTATTKETAISAKTAARNSIDNANTTRFTAPLPNLPIKYSRGESQHDNQPDQRVASSWEKFWDALANDRGTAKGQQYVCGAMKIGKHPDEDKYPHEAHYRRRDGAEDCLFLPFDCDHIPADMFDSLLTLLDEFDGCSYTTSSHSPENPRARLFIALSRPVTRDERIRVGKAFERYVENRGCVGIQFDASVYQTEQMCYLPLKGAVFYDHKGGVALDVDALLSSKFSYVEDEAGAGGACFGYFSNGFNTLPVDAQREVLEEIRAGIKAHKQLGKDRGFDSTEAQKLAEEVNAQGARLCWCWQFDDDAMPSVISELTKVDVNSLNRGQWISRVMLAARFAPVGSDDAEKIKAAVRKWSEMHTCYEGYLSSGNDTPELEATGGKGDPFKDFNDRWAEGEASARIDNAPFRRLSYIANNQMPVPKVLLADGSVFELFDQRGQVFALEYPIEQAMFENAGVSNQGKTETAWQARERIINEIVNRYNARYFIATEGGRNFVYDEEFVDELNFGSLNRTLTTAFKEIRRNQEIRLPTGKTDENGKREYEQVPEVELWWRSPIRRAYPGGLRLIPTGPCPKDIYNLWKGFGVQPAKGDCAPVLNFILAVVCNNNLQSFDYLMGWLAYGVQYPERQAEVAVVMRGGKGIGKGTLGKIMKRIFGSHALQITNVKHLTGNFNGHLRSTLLLFADEAFWARDKAGESVLKGLVTEPTLTIEQKSIDVYPVPNRLKIIMASNAEWVVPASGDERRFFVLDVSDKHQGDHEYWASMNSAIQSDECLGAFLAHLQKYDLSNFNIRNPPNTKGLDDQKLSSLDPINAVMFEALEAGELAGLEWSTKEPFHYPCNSFKNIAVEYCKTHKRHSYETPNNTNIGTEIKKSFGDIRKRGQVGYEGKRPWIYSFPPLEAARDMFCRRHRLSAVVWGAIDSE